MRDALPHLEDYQLAQKCLEHEPSALLKLQEVYGPTIRAYLMRAGASEAAADEVASELLTDCIVADEPQRARLLRYDGTCRLSTWLNTVALNRFISNVRARQRWEEKHAPIPEGIKDDEDGGHGPTPIAAPEQADFDEPLVELIRDAITHAFRACSAENFVLLQLVHADRVRRSEIARVWNCDQSKISRLLKQASSEVEDLAMRHIRAQDAWLEVNWVDFLDICRAASLGAIGLE